MTTTTRRPTRLRHLAGAAGLVTATTLAATLTLGAGVAHASLPSQQPSSTPAPAADDTVDIGGANPNPGNSTPPPSGSSSLVTKGQAPNTGAYTPPPDNSNPPGSSGPATSSDPSAQPGSAQPGSAQPGSASVSSDEATSEGVSGPSGTNPSGTNPSGTGPSATNGASPHVVITALNIVKGSGWGLLILAVGLALGLAAVVTIARSRRPVRAL